MWTAKTHIFWVHRECIEGWLGPIPKISLQGGHISITIAREAAWVFLQLLLEDEDVSCVLKIDATEGSIKQWNHQIQERNIPVLRWRVICDSDSHGNAIEISHQNVQRNGNNVWGTFELFHLITTDKSSCPLVESLQFLKFKIHTRLNRTLPRILVVSDDDDVIHKSFNMVFNGKSSAECLEDMWNYVCNGKPQYIKYEMEWKIFVTVWGSDLDLGVVCLSENWHERQSPKEYFKKPFWKHVENMTARQKKLWVEFIEIFRLICATRRTQW